MEKDIERLKEKLEEFMKKYNVTLKAETVIEGCTLDGKIVNPKLSITIYS